MKIKHIDGALLKKMIIFAANNLENNKDIVNDLNVFPVPDGDTGTNMSLTIQFAAKEVSEVATNSLEKIADAASRGSLMGARGNSGVILSQLFRGFAKACKDKEVLDIHDFSMALKSGSDMAYKAVMKPTEGTILTVARESASYAMHNTKNFKTLDVFIEKIIEWANITLDKTPNMLPVLKEAGVVDAGGKGLIYIFEGAYKALFGNDLEVDIKSSPEKHDKTHAPGKSHISTADIQFAYCTEFIVLSKNPSINSFKTELSQLGDSLLVVGDEERIKVHVHTNHPGKALEYALQMGEVTNIKIDNMKEQHRSQLNLETQKVENIELKDYAFIAVSAGEGIVKVFEDLGVESIIKGGQTMNPSTEDFLIELEKLQAKNIFILPNNSNIFLAADQAKQISDKSVHVLPTRTIPQGIAALLAFNPEQSVEDNYNSMEKTINEVKTGQITFAVRDTQVNGMEIHKEDIIGLLDGDIVVVGKDIEKVALQLLDKMVEEEDELVTIFTGEDVSKDQSSNLLNKIEERFQDIDIENLYGGQPLYYYIISVE
ncbi:DAK2 domain-containing protein [Irregularibacter muris]|nr:DAK2 domain-containing protein [Irregularibacter muris]